VVSKMLMVSVHMVMSIWKIARKIVFFILFIILIPIIYIVYINKIYLFEWSMFSMIRTPIFITFVVDPIGIIFSRAVLFISANVLIFSLVYIDGDKFVDRFTVLVLIFVMSINLLIFIPHFMILLLGWDGLGIVSFILVIYYQNPKSLAAGLITAITNRIGDVLLLLSIAWTLNQGHWNIMNIWITDIYWIQIICIMVAAITKRAQIPFSRWLPAAIAAPTPVSALVHSSTLVTAGVFLLIRFYSFLRMFKYFNLVLLVIAVCTILMAGIRAITECDIKKIIALSTLRQLGIIMTALGLGMPQLAFFHIITHALFKALLFVCAGGFINSHLHAQDLRWMGNLVNQLPISMSCISVANLALCGFPFLAGFYSKDAIIEYAIRRIRNIFIVFLIMFRIGLTSFYSMRFRISVIWSRIIGATMLIINEKLSIIKPIFNLSIMSVVIGGSLIWLSPLCLRTYILPFYLKIIPLLMVMCGVLMAWIIMVFVENSMLINVEFRHYARCIMWYLVPLSRQFMINYPFVVAHKYLKDMDQGWLEISSGQGFAKFIFKTRNLIMIDSPILVSSYLIVSRTFIIIFIMFISIYVI